MFIYLRVIWAICGINNRSEGVEAPLQTETLKAVNTQLFVVGVCGD